ATRPRRGTVAQRSTSTTCRPTCCGRPWPARCWRRGFRAGTRRAGQPARLCAHQVPGEWSDEPLGLRRLGRHAENLAEDVQAARTEADDAGPRLARRPAQAVEAVQQGRAERACQVRAAHAPVQAALAERTPQPGERMKVEA